MPDMARTGCAVVTGASRGIGHAIARRLSKSGWPVVAIARRRSEELEALAREMSAEGGGSIGFVGADLGHLDAIPDLVRRIRGEFGAIGALVNNAGIGTEGLLATMPDARIGELLRVNVEAPIVLTKYVLRTMMADAAPGRRPGRIVTISSIVASTGYNALSVYGASKAATIGFTRSLAREVGRLGITVNAVAPGFVETAMTAGLSAKDRDRIRERSALRMLPITEDVAAAVEYLLGDAADRVTGTVLTVDAGSTA